VPAVSFTSLFKPSNSALTDWIIWHVNVKYGVEGKFVPLLNIVHVTCVFVCCIVVVILVPGKTPFAVCSKSDKSLKCSTIPWRPGEQRYNSIILDIHAKWSSVGNFALRPHYPPMEEPKSQEFQLDSLCQGQKSSCPCRKSNPDLPARSPSQYRLRYPREHEVWGVDIIQDQIVCSWSERHLCSLSEEPVAVKRLNILFLTRRVWRDSVVATYFLDVKQLSAKHL
jgi:hypothetical protein